MNRLFRQSNFLDIFTVRMVSIALLFFLAACQPDPQIKTASDVTIRLPDRAKILNDPNHEIALSASLSGGLTSIITIDPYPAGAADNFPAIADFFRTSEERITTRESKVQNKQGFEITLRRYLGEKGDFHSITALAKRADTALLIRLAESEKPLSPSQIGEIEHGLDVLLQSLK